MPSRIRVIHNPVAGRRRRHRLRQLLKMLAASGHSVRARPTAHADDARDIAREVQDVDLIVAAGGDGTVNEIVDGLTADDRQGPVPAVAFLPLGTANVLAWALNLPHRPAALMRMIEQGRTVAVRPGIANDRRFILMASAGLDARAVAAVKTTVKRVLGGAA
ncbi:MAG: diacylglycerol kinase family protein [Rhodospirillaceae bacterium]